MAGLAGGDERAGVYQKVVGIQSEDPVMPGPHSADEFCLNGDTDFRVCLAC